MFKDTALELRETDAGVLMRVKVVPGASRTRVAGVLEGALKITVTAAPEKGRANTAVIKHLAKLLKIPARSISVEKGHSVPNKLLRVEGLKAGEVARLLGVSGR